MGRTERWSGVEGFIDKGYGRGEKEVYRVFVSERRWRSIIVGGKVMEWCGLVIYEMRVK